MTLLELDQVSKRLRDGLRERIVLGNVSLELDGGEYIVIWGRRGSGRSTLLAIAAGIQEPDSGTVQFQGSDLAAIRGDALGEGIGYCQTRLGCREGHGILDEVMVALLARGVAPPQARARAIRALERVGVDHSSIPPGELETGDAVRVALARTLALQPLLIVIDEPTSGVELIDRDGILLLLRSLANDGIAVLASTSESTGLSGADRSLALSDGQLRGSLTPELGTVLPLHDSERRRASG